MAFKRYIFILPNGKTQPIMTGKQSVQTIIEAFVNNPQLSKDEYGRYVVNNVNSFKAVLTQIFRG